MAGALSGATNPMDKGYSSFSKVADLPNRSPVATCYRSLAQGCAACDEIVINYDDKCM